MFLFDYETDSEGYLGNLRQPEVCKRKPWGHKHQLSSVPTTGLLTSCGCLKHLESNLLINLLGISKSLLKWASFNAFSVVQPSFSYIPCHPTLWCSYSSLSTLLGGNSRLMANCPSTTNLQRYFSHIPKFLLGIQNFNPYDSPTYFCTQLYS